MLYNGTSPNIHPIRSSLFYRGPWRPHFREYSKDELYFYLKYCGFRVLKHEYFERLQGDYYLKNDFLNNENHNMCETLAQCYFTFILDGLRKHGGIGDIMKKYSLITSPGHYMARFFFDFSFFIIVVVILLNIVFGIIIDTFRDLRQYLHRKEKDILTVCFICGLNIDELERKNKNFEQHTEEDHNIWNYVYYMIGLELTNRNDMNAINSEVYEKIKKMEISWFPYENDNSSVEDN